MVIIWIITCIVLLFLVFNIYTWAAPQFGRRPDKNNMKKLANNAVYNDGKFQNPGDPPIILPKSFRKILRLQFDKNPGRVPDTVIPSVIPAFGDTTNNGNTSLFWLGHSSVLIRIDKMIILTDPVFSKRASPVTFIGPKSFKYENPITPENIPFPDVILLSHDHFDHLDYKTIRNYYTGVKTFYVPLGAKSHLLRWGVPDKNITEFDWWLGVHYNDSLEFIATPAQHFSGRKGQDNSTLWCSWVIKGKTKTIYFSADSGYSGHFNEIGKKHGPFDITLMESGAYGQYWPNIHMLPEESVRAHLDLKGNILLPIHWGKFNLAFHPWKEPVQRIAAEADKLGVTLTTPLPGQEVSLDSKLPQTQWWEVIE